VYTADALDAQRLLPRLSGQQDTAFCGAYHGWGFHEDGCVSGIRAALALGFAW
jgi:predicted NAD/FAD-binding protein